MFLTDGTEFGAWLDEEERGHREFQDQIRPVHEARTALAFALAEKSLADMRIQIKHAHAALSKFCKFYPLDEEEKK